MLSSTTLDMTAIYTAQVCQLQIKHAHAFSLMIFATSWGGSAESRNGMERNQLGRAPSRKIV